MFKTVSICLGLVSMLASGVSASPMEDFLQQLEGQRDSACRLPEESLKRLIDQIGASKTTEDRAIGLQYLSSQSGWRTDDHPSSLVAVNALGKNSDTLELLAARALSVAHNELFSPPGRILSAPRSTYRDYMRDLITANQGKNRFYLSFIQMTLADSLLASVFETALNDSLPLDLGSKPDTADQFAEALTLYRSLQSFYGPLSQSSQLYSRDMTLDFEYQIALLEFASGLPDWQKTLQEIITTESAKDAYTQTPNFHHIYVQSYLRPPVAEQIGTVTSEELGGGCPQRVNGDPTREWGWDTNTIVRKFFNPTQLALWTCTVLNAPPAQFSIIDLARALGQFENHDYRVVLGHFRGAGIRFSFLTKDAFVENTTVLQADITNRFTPSAVFSNAVRQSSCAADISADLYDVSAKLGIQQEPDGRGYFYIGENLTFNDATRLLRLVQQDKNFANAYLIRPIID